MDSLVWTRRGMLLLTLSQFAIPVSPEDKSGTVVLTHLLDLMLDLLKIYRRHTTFRRRMECPLEEARLVLVKEYQRI